MANFHRLSFRLSRVHRSKIDDILRKGSHQIHVIKRALLLRDLDNHYQVAIIAEIVNVASHTVYNTASTFLNYGLDSALYDAPRTGRSPLLTVSQDSRIVALACSVPPDGCSRWTIRLLVETAKKTKIVMEIGRETVRKLLKFRAIRPWREKMWYVPHLDDE